MDKLDKLDKLHLFDDYLRQGHKLLIDLKAEFCLADMKQKKFMEKLDKAKLNTAPSRADEQSTPNILVWII